MCNWHCWFKLLKVQENLIFKVFVSFMLWSLWGIRRCKMGPNSGGLPAPEPVEAPDPHVGFCDALVSVLEIIAIEAVCGALRRGVCWAEGLVENRRGVGPGDWWAEGLWWPAGLGVAVAAPGEGLGGLVRWCRMGSVPWFPAPVVHCAVKMSSGAPLARHVVLFGFI